MNQRFKQMPGLILALILSLLAQFCSAQWGISGALLALAFGIVFGISLGRSVSYSPIWEQGFAWSERQGLGLAIALMGFQMPWQALFSSGWQVLFLVILALLFTFIMAFMLSKLFGLSQAQRLLMATGNGICGSAAVMATQSIIQSNRADTAMVVTVVNLLGLLGILVTPVLVAQYFPADDFSAGQLIGNTLQSMPHVVAAGFSVNDDVAQTAVWVKMVRILMLLPVLFLLAWWQHRQLDNQAGIENRDLPWLALIPVFIWGFMLCALLSLWIEIPQTALKVLDQVSDVLMCMALVAIGAQIQWQKIRQSGGRLLIVGLLLFALQMVFSGLLIANL